MSCVGTRVTCLDYVKVTPGVHADAVEARHRSHEVARPGDDVPRHRQVDTRYQISRQADSRYIYSRSSVPGAGAVAGGDGGGGGGHVVVVAVQGAAGQGDGPAPVLAVAG